jgi:tRNA(adenine34) deaminase
VDLPSAAALNHHATFEGGMLADECAAMLKRFFAARR